MSFLAHFCIPVSLYNKNGLLRCLINDSISLSFESNVGAYACTTVMLKGTAHRRMVMSLIEIGQHPLTGFHDVLVNKKSSAMLAFVLFSTDENLVSFLRCCFVEVLPSNFSESKGVPSVPVHFVC